MHLNSSLTRIFIVFVFCVTLFNIAAGPSCAEDSAQQYIYAAGFVSGQTYQIEFLTEGGSLFLSCDADGNLSLIPDAEDETTEWTAAADFSHDFSLASSTGLTLGWGSVEGSEAPALTAKKRMAPKMIETILEEADGLSELVVKSILDEAIYVGKYAEPEESMPDLPPDGEKPDGPPPDGERPDRPPSGDGRGSSEWIYSYQGGKGSLSGDYNSVKWYICIDAENKPAASRNAGDAAAIRLRTDGIGGGDIIKGAPSVAAPVIKSSRPASPSRFTITTQNIPSGVTPAYHWTMDGKAVSQDQILIIRNARLLSAGVHEIQCEISFTDEYGTVFDQYSWVTNFIVCNGILENSLITFSDVHETFENIGQAIADTMTENNGKIPALVVCTGDWTTAHPNASAETVNNYHIPMLNAQIGGIDTVFVSGNHEPAETAVAANQAAGLGYNGSGVIFRTDPGRKSTSGKIRDLIVFGINFDETAVIQDKTTVYSYENVYERLQSFLETLSKDYHGENILISSHTGLHVLGVQEESLTSEWGGENKYNLDGASDVVALLNSYAENYGMKFIFLFGHDHSKSESEFYLEPGDTITSTVSYETKETLTQTLSFYYGHAGYLTDTIGGTEHFTLLTWNRDSMKRSLKQAGSAETPTGPDQSSGYEPLLPLSDFSWLDHLPATGFSAVHMTAVRPRPQGLSYGKTGMTLQIPKLDVSEEILSIPNVNGTYPVEWMGSNVGLLEQSSLPGEGVTVLTGHNHLNTTEAGPFVLLESLEAGDRIFVNSLTGDEMMKYSVYGNYKISPDGFASIAGGLSEDTLVLITCEDESVDGGYLYRRVIFSEPLY